jgi:hypothetical protein
MLRPHVRAAWNPFQLYFTSGTVFHKSLEIGGGKAVYSDKGFDWYLRFRTKGDHAGLTFRVELVGCMFEFNIHDERHWNWREDRFCLPGEDPVFNDDLDE